MYLLYLTWLFHSESERNLTCIIRQYTGCKDHIIQHLVHYTLFKILRTVHELFKHRPNILRLLPDILD